MSNSGRKVCPIIPDGSLQAILGIGFSMVAKQPVAQYELDTLSKATSNKCIEKRCALWVENKHRWKRGRCGLSGERQ